MNWIPIVGKGYTAKDFLAYCAAFQLGAWRPQFVVLHNTAEPTLANWHVVSGQQRMLNLASYYRDTQKWHAGPHLFVADDFIWIFTPLDQSGVHSPSWNRIAWGVELVGNYESEAFGNGVQLNAIAALAGLHRLGQLDPQTLRLHKEDPLTTHNCPGKNVVKADVIGWVAAQLNNNGVNA